MANPYIYNQLAQVRAQMGRAPGVTGAQLAELLRLRRRGEVADQGSKEALDRLKGLGAQSQEVAGEMQSVYSDVPVYKRPQREGVSKGAMNFGLLLGGLGALAGVEDPQNLTGTAIGGQKALKDQEYYDALDTLKERQDADREARMGRIQGLQAKLSGLGTQMDVAQTEQRVLGNESSRIGAELFNREQSAQNQANVDRKFNYEVFQNGILNGYRKKQDQRDQESHDIDVTIRKNPYAFIGGQADFLAKQGVMNGDKGRIMQGMFSDLIKGANDAELSTFKLDEAKEWAKLLPEQIAFQKWSWENEKKEALARINSYNRSNRGTPGATVQDFQFGTTAQQIEKLQETIRGAEAGLASEDAKYRDVTDKSYAQNRTNAINQIAAWKQELLGLQSTANGLKPGAFDVRLAESDPYIKIKGAQEYVRKLFGLP